MCSKGIWPHTRATSYCSKRPVLQTKRNSSAGSQIPGPALEERGIQNFGCNPETVLGPGSFSDP